MEVPLGIDISLMELLKGRRISNEAICGGMAIYGTCRVEVLNQDEIMQWPKRMMSFVCLETLPCYIAINADCLAKYEYLKR